MQEVEIERKQCKPEAIIINTHDNCMGTGHGVLIGLDSNERLMVFSNDERVTILSHCS